MVSGRLRPTLYRCILRTSSKPLDYCGDFSWLPSENAKARPRSPDPVVIVPRDREDRTCGPGCQLPSRRLILRPVPHL